MMVISYSHLIYELDAVKKHVVKVMLVDHVLVNNVLRLQCWVV